MSEKGAFLNFFPCVYMCYQKLGQTMCLGRRRKNTFFKQHYEAYRLMVTVKVPLAYRPSGQCGVIAPSCLWHGMWKTGPSPLLSPPLTFLNQLPICCWVDSVSFPVFWLERDSNLRPSAPQPNELTTRPRRLSYRLMVYGQTKHKPQNDAVKHWNGGWCKPRLSRRYGIAWSFTSFFFQVMPRKCTFE